MKKGRAPGRGTAGRGDGGWKASCLGKAVLQVFPLEGVSILLGIQELPTLSKASGHACDMRGYPVCTQEWDRRARVCNTHLSFVKLYFS